MPVVEKATAAKFPDCHLQPNIDEVMLANANYFLVWMKCLQVEVNFLVTQIGPELFNCN